VFVTPDSIHVPAAHLVQAAATLPALIGTKKKSVDPLTPPEIRQQLVELEQWAIANKKDYRRDTISFWSLKIPAILTSTSAGILVHCGLTVVGVITGAIASACVLVDGVLSRGMLRNIHLRAYHDIRILGHDMVAEWRSRDTSADPSETARLIIRRAAKERRRIATYVRDAETALKSHSHP
jgi:hypothetical protein